MRSSRFPPAGANQKGVMIWTDAALCRTEMTQLEAAFTFFRENDDEEGIAEAVAICTRCPVRVSCLEFALRGEENQPKWLGAGIFGGKSPDERWAIRKQRKEDNE